MNSPARIVLVDDHPILMMGLRSLLSSELDMQVVGEATSGDEAMRMIQNVKPDLAIVDISMPGMNGIKVAEALRKRDCSVRILMLTGYEDRTYVARAFQAGTNGYVLKCSIPGTLIPAIRAILAGVDYVDPAIGPPTWAQSRAFRPPESGCEDEDAARPSTSRNGGGAAGAELTERERQVLKLIARGLANKEIAKLLSLSVKSIETYKARGVAKLGLRNRYEIMRFGIANGWMDG